MGISAIIVAAGRGNRVGGALPKQFQQVGGKPILSHTLQKFEDCAKIDEVILVTAPEWQTYTAQQIIDGEGFKKVRKIVAGGSERQDSVYAGLSSIGPDHQIVLIHDAARPFVSIKKITEVIAACESYDAAILAIPAKDTIKVDIGGFVHETLDREKLWSVQTPQAFKYDLLKRAYDKAFEDGVYQTDDSALVERLGAKVKIVLGEDDNIKITVAADFQFAELIIRKE